MEKEFVPYELAVKLKGLGFDEPCLARWDGGGFYMLPAYDPLKNSEIKEPWFCVLPLWQQAFDWFREKKGYYGDIYRVGTKYKVVIECMTTGTSWDSIDESMEYLKARQACLEKLIELVNPKP